MKKNAFQSILILLLLAIPVISSPDFDGSLSVFQAEPFQRDFIRFILIIVFFYFNLLILLPKLYNNKKYFIFISTVILSYSVIVFTPFYFIPNNQDTVISSRLEETSSPVNSSIVSFSQGKEQKLMHGPPHFSEKKDNTLAKKIFTSLLPFLFSLLSSFFIYKSIQQRELEKLKAKADLLNLRYQLQPHFLFNVLNSVYSLSLLKSDDAPNGILKLSNVMRFVVQESSNDFVELSKEVAYLKDYIALQLIRTDDSLDFSFSENGDYENKRIAPFILITFIENAFKYGFNAEKESKINIELQVKDQQLSFSVFNYKVTENIGHEGSLKIGLKNTLEHLKQAYPQKHSISIDDQKNSYQVELKINLA